MTSTWYELAAESRGESAWELYHENAKRSRDDGMPVRAAAPAPQRDYSDLTALALAPASSPASPAPATSTAVPLPSLAELLHQAVTAVDEPVDVFVSIEAVTGLPECLGWYDARAGALRVIRDGRAGKDLDGALVTPGIRKRAGAIVFIAADFELATAAAGERGYRAALIAAGRRLYALEAAIERVALSAEPVEFYDREADALLRLGGLAQSVVAAVAVLGKPG